MQNGARRLIHSHHSSPDHTLMNVLRPSHENFERESLTTFSDTSTLVDDHNTIDLTFLDAAPEEPLDFRLDLDEHNWLCILSRVTLPHYAARWRRVAIFASFIDAYDIIAAQLLRVNAPNVEMFSLICLDIQDGLASSTTSDSPPLPLLSRWSNVRTLRVQNIGLPTELSHLTWLTTLHLDEYRPTMPIDFAHFSSMMLSIPSLKHLSIYGCFIHRWPMRPSLSLPNLISLRVGQTESLRQLFSSVCFERLSTLVLKDVRSIRIKEMLHSPTSSIASLGVSLERLTLSGCHTSEDTLRQLFTAFSCITQLDMLNFPVDDAISLLAKFGEEQYLPSLKTLTVHYFRALTDVESCLVRLFSLRSNMTAPLSCLCVHDHVQTIHVQCNDVKVERWRRLEAWPPGQEYEDPDDMFLHLSSRFCSLPFSKEMEFDKYRISGLDNFTK